MEFEKIYSCGSKMTISYKNNQPVITFKFSFSKNTKEIESDYNFFLKRTMSIKTKKLLFKKEFLEKH